MILETIIKGRKALEDRNRKTVVVLSFFYVGAIPRDLDQFNISFTVPNGTTIDKMLIALQCL